MKKTLAMLLAVAMVSALCGMLFVSAEATNLAAGKEVANAAVNGNNPAYNAGLTDGAAADEITFDGNWFGFYYHPDKTNDENAAAGANSTDGIASPVIDLGASYAVESVRVHAFLGSNSGILAPSAVSVEISADGETYTKAGEITIEGSDAADKVEWVSIDVNADARYVRINMTHVSTWLFVNEIEVYGAEAGGNDDEPSEEPSEEPSADEPSADEPSKEESKAPATGDAGIIVFAVLGVVAVCGAAVVVKARG